MNDAPREPIPLRLAAPAAPVDAGEVNSAGRRCLVILLLGVAVLVVLCVGVGARWAGG